MLASSWLIRAPTHTAATASQCALGRSRTEAGRRGSTRNRSHPQGTGFSLLAVMHPCWTHFN